MNASIVLKDPSLSLVMLCHEVYSTLSGITITTVAFFWLVLAF